MKALAPFVAVPMLGALVNYYMGRKDEKKELENLNASLAQLISSHPKLSASPEKTIERFQELSYIAPVVASNPKMAAKFIEPRLEKGLTVDDIHKLSVIQHSGTVSKKPAASAKAALTAGSLAQTVASIYGYQGIDKTLSTYREGVEEVANALNNNNADRDSRGGMMNKQSSAELKFSDECIGEMLADRYLVIREDLIKEASDAKTTLFSESLKGLKRGAAMVAPYILVGGAIHGASMVMDAMAKKKLHEQADDAFRKIQKNSEIIKQNPELAVEALDAIKTFAPALAAKPAVLKTFVEHTVNVGNIAPQTMNDLAMSQFNYNRSRPGGSAGGFMSGITSVIGLKDKVHPTSEESAHADYLDSMHGNSGKA